MFWFKESKYLLFFAKSKIKDCQNKIKLKRNKSDSLSQLTQIKEIYHPPPKKKYMKELKLHPGKQVKPAIAITLVLYLWLNIYRERANKVCITRAQSYFNILLTLLYYLTCTMFLNKLAWIWLNVNVTILIRICMAFSDVPDLAEVAFLQKR